MLLVVGTIRVATERLAEARPVMRAMVEATRAEEGCIAYHYAEDMLAPGLIHVVERWQDRAALDRHFASVHLATWRSHWPRLGIGERALTLFDGSVSEAL